MKIVLEIVPAKEMRYNTQGDWHFKRDGTLLVQAIECPHPEYCHLVLIHELIEALDCLRKGIGPDLVDAHDFASKADDPGSESRAPYNNSHRLATGIENILAAAWGVDWKHYESELEHFSKELPPNPTCQT